MAVQFPNIYNVEITKGPAVKQLSPMFYADKAANRIGANLFQNGQPYSPGGSCAGTAVLSDNTTVALTGVINGNQAYVDLTQACYSVQGPIRVFVSCVDGSSNITTVVAGFGNVTLTETGTIIDPGTIIPSVSALIADIDAAVESIPQDYSTLSNNVDTLSDNVDALTQRVDDAQELAANAMQGIAPVFAPTAAYSAGNHVWYRGLLYRFTADHAAGDWTGTDAEEVTIGAEVADLKSAISGKIMLTSNAVNALIAILNEMVTSSDIAAKVAVLEEELQYVEPVVQLCYIANNLTHATTSNGATTVNKGGVYAATITADSTYTLETITVMMGGVDITSTAVSGNVVSIAEVTDDITITAIATKTIHLTPIRTSSPGDQTYNYTASTWYNGVTFENRTISGGTMIVEFDDEIATNFQFRICVLDNSKEPYECAGYKNPNNVSVEGTWTPYYYAVGATGISYATAAKSFSFEIPDNCYAFCYIQFVNNVVYGGQEVTSNSEATTWALNGGITVGIKGGVEDEQ